MRNLLEETLGVLSANGKKPEDVYWVGTPELNTGWSEFVKIANVEYNPGYGSQEVATDLLVVGNGWWLERHEYDGSEWWEFKNQPLATTEKTNLIAVTTEQAEQLGFDVSCGWNDLQKINGRK